MINVTFQNDTNTVTSADGLYQWDVGQILRINGLNLSVAPKVHFATKVDETAYVVQSEMNGGTITVGIPDKVLTHGYPVIAYVYLEQGTDKRTIKSITISVIKRAKPNGWRETNSEDIIEAVNFYEQLTNDLANEMQELRDLLEAIDSSGGGFIGHMTNTNNPHAVTANQVGAPDMATFNAHKNDKNNPHAVTVSQVGARPNANLLHNWYFLNPVNRKGQTEYDTGMYTTIDRWKNTSGNFTTAVSDNGLVITDKKGGVPNIIFDQANAELVNLLIGKTVTVSALVTSVTGKLVLQAGGKALTVTDTGLHSFTIDSFSEANYLLRIFNQENYSSITITAMKVEVGDKQTLAYQDASGNWVLTEIPDYAEQLAICTQYNLSTGALVGLNALYLPLDGGEMTGYPTVGNNAGYYALVKNRTLNSNNYKLTMGIDSVGGGTTLEHFTNDVVDGRLLLSSTMGSGSLLQVGTSHTDLYDIYGSHNITCGTADLTAGTSALANDCYYDVYK